MASLQTIFGIDLRTLALFRIGLGLCILADLASRARDLTAHYSDQGVLPRADLIVLGHKASSLHMISGSPWAQALLFFAAGCAAVALIVGVWTRLATFASWIMLGSLIARNTIVVQGGDNLLLLLLFWSLFLPLGARYSIDAAVNRTPDAASSYWSMATTALLVQVMALYFFSALLKSGPEWIPDGTAIAYALHLDFFATPFGVWLRGFPSVTYGLTLYVWYLELLAPLLIFSPLWFRSFRWLMVVGLATLHIAIAACMNVGLFPLINLVALSPFLPPAVWNWFQGWIDRRQGQGVTIYYDGDCEFCRKTCLILQTFLLLKRVTLVPAQTVGDVSRIMEEQETWIVEDESGNRRIRWEALAFLFAQSPFSWIGTLMGLRPVSRLGNVVYRWIASNRMRLGAVTGVAAPYHSSSATASRTTNLAVGALMIYVLVINIQGLPVAGYSAANPSRFVRPMLGLNQRWDMFAPAPPSMDVWFVVQGELLNGAVVDVLRGTEGEPDPGKPDDVWSYYSTYRWRKYLSRLAEPQFQRYRPAYANYLCRVWERSHRESSVLRQLKLYVRAESNEPDGREPRQDTLLLLVHNCPENKDPR